MVFNVFVLLGIVGGFGLLVFSVIVDGGYIALYLSVGSALIVLGGTLAATITSYTIKELSNLVKAIYSKALYTNSNDYSVLINEIADLSDKARKEGLLALEDSIEGIKDPFFKKGVQLVVDGADPELVKDILNIYMDACESRHMAIIGMLRSISGFFPAFGMIGTILGLIKMLANLEDKASIGMGMSTALLTTLYGSVLANLIAIPLSNRLERNSQTELSEKGLILEGIISIQSGDNPAIVMDKLNAYVSNSEAVKNKN